MKVCIYGAANNSIDKIYFDEVYALASGLAQKGASLVFGGGAAGMMGICAKAFYENSQPIIGVAPEFFNRPGILYENCTELIITNTMRERKAVMEEQSDAFIAVPGGIGTLEELFEIMTLRQLNQLDKPLIFYNVNGYYNDLLNFIEKMKAEGFMRKTQKEHLFYVANSPGEVYSIIL